ncbi:MAG: ABC transporter ATP-binding protein/permease [Lachnospiraceae bacterium]|nr:ABC transporter ATP-binding protein/permease [Lachnospiraceae bacterium]
MRKYICPKPFLYVLTILFIIINCFTGAYFSVIIGKIVDTVGEGVEALVKALVFGLLFVVLSVGIDILGGILKEKMTAESRKAVKHDLFSAILSKPISDLSEANTAEFINDLSNNIGMFEQNYVNAFFSLTSVIAMFVSASVITLTLEPLMLIVMIVLALITLFVTENVRKTIEKRSKEYITKNSEYMAEIKDDLSASYVIKSFGVIGKMLDKHGKKNAEIEHAKFSLGFIQTICSNAGQLVGLMSTVLVMSAAAYYAINGRFSAGMIITFGSLIGQIVSPVASFPTVISRFSTAKPVVERFKTLLKSEAKTKNTVRKAGLNDKIEVRNVSFSFGDKRVLNGVSACFERGKKYAVTGMSGGGKSTFINVITGLLTASSGEVTYDGININDISEEDRSRMISIVPQDTFLFNDTVRNNLTLFSDEITEKSLYDALKRAGIAELVESLPNGLDTVIAENGKNFSGGEKQRFALARAFLRNSPVLVLDEGTSAVDSETAGRIESLLLTDKEITLIAVTHNDDPGYLKNYDAELRL